MKFESRNEREGWRFYVTTTLTALLLDQNNTFLLEEAIKRSIEIADQLIEAERRRYDKDLE
jgi:hypothetical protein